MNVYINIYSSWLSLLGAGGYGDLFTSSFLVAVLIPAIFGLPYAVGSLVQSGFLRRFRNEADALKYLCSTLGAIFGVATAWVILGDSLSDFMVIRLFIAGVLGSIVAWFAFENGAYSGQQVVGKELDDLFGRTSSFIAYLEQEHERFAEEHDKALSRMEEVTSRAKDKLERLDDQIHDAIFEALDYRVTRIRRQVEDFLLKATAEIKATQEHLISKISQMLGEVVAVASDKSQEGRRQFTSELAASAPSDAQRRAKIISMISMNLLTYRPIHHKLCLAIYSLVKSRQDEGYRPTLSDIAAVSGVNKNDVKVRLQELANAGLVIMNKGQKRIEFLLADKLKNLFYPVLENQREGGVESAYLIQAAKDHHLMQEHYFEALRQQIGKELCDAISIPRLDRDNFDILKSIAVEVESPEEVRAHPDQVRANMLKNLQLFIKTEVWCYEENKNAIERIRDELGTDAMSRIDVIAVQKDGSN